MTLGEVLAHLLEPLGYILPRVTERPEETDVIVVNTALLRNYAVNRAVFYVPLFTKVNWYSTAPTPLDLGTQSLYTKDGQHLHLNASIIYEIVDAVELNSECNSENFEELISLLVRKLIREKAVKLSKEEIVGGALDDLASPEMDEIGIRVEGVILEDSTFPFMIKTL